MADDGEGSSLDYKQIIKLLTTKYAVWLLIFVGIAVHFNGLFGSFLGDDKTQIQYNYFIQSLSHLPKFFTGSTFVPTTGTNLVGFYYKPMLTLSYAILYALFQARPFYFHAFQLILHITNGVLLFILFKKFLKEHIAVVLSLIFLVHPINSEAVAYIADLQEPLFFCFGLSALLLAMKETISLRRAVLVSFLLFCSIMSKETGILFTCMVIATRLFIRWRRSELLHSLLYAIPPILMYAWLRFGVAKLFISKVTGTPISLLTLGQRILNIPAIIFYYLKLSVYPVTLDFWQPWVVKRLTLTNFVLPLVADSLFFAAILFLGIYLYRKHNSYFLPCLFFALWFLIGIGFHSQLIPLDTIVSERWFYFPIIGLLGMIGVVWQSQSERFQWKQHTASFTGVIMALMLTLLSVRTLVRNTNWTNEITLYNHDLAITDSSILENNLGNDYLAEKNYQQAIIRYQRSAALEPALISYYNTALAYYDANDLKNAEVYYQKALAANKTSRDHEDFKMVGNKIYDNLTFIYIVSHEYPAAEQLAAKGIATYPHDGLLWDNLAVSQYTQGEKIAARKSIAAAMIYLPDNRVTQYVYQQITTNQPI